MVVLLVAARLPILVMRVMGFVRQLMNAPLEFVGRLTVQQEMFLPQLTIVVIQPVCSINPNFL